MLHVGIEDELNVVYLAQYLGMELYETVNVQMPSLLCAIVCVGCVLYVHMLFFVPSLLCSGCGHCKRLSPAYEEVGKAFENSDNIIIAKVDADAHKALGKQFGVTGFPTLKFFPKGSTEPEA